MSRIALITGGAKGIGAEITRALARDGWSVRINYHTSEKMALALARDTGGEAIRADVRDFAQVREMFRGAGPVELLVNNAGIAAYGLFTETDIATWRNLFSVNVDGVYNCIQCALPRMLGEKQGNIINIASVWGMVGASCEVGYSAAKAAVIGLTKALAKELGPSGIRVNAVAPGAVETDMLGEIAPEDLEAVRLETPLRMVGSPGDIASLVEFLASDKARFITGQIISPNGGLAI